MTELKRRGRADLLARIWCAVRLVSAQALVGCFLALIAWTAARYLSDKGEDKSM
jgi:hypothetical protein